MRVIKADGPAEERTPNIVNPGDTVVKWPEVESAGPITVKPDAVPFRPLPQPKPLPPMPRSAVYIAGEDSKRDFVVKSTREGVLRTIRAKAEGKRWADMQPRSTGKINDPAEEEPWPYVVKLAKPVPRPNLKFNPETFTHISNNVKSSFPRYGVVEEEPRVLVPRRAEDIRHIAIKPGNYLMARPKIHFLDQIGGHIVARPR